MAEHHQPRNFVPSLNPKHWFRDSLSRFTFLLYHLLFCHGRFLLSQFQVLGYHDFQDPPHEARRQVDSPSQRNRHQEKHRHIQGKHQLLNMFVSKHERMNDVNFQRQPADEGDSPLHGPRTP